MVEGKLRKEIVKKRPLVGGRGGKKDKGRERKEMLEEDRGRKRQRKKVKS